MADDNEDGPLGELTEAVPKAFAAEGAAQVSAVLKGLPAFLQAAGDSVAHLADYLGDEGMQELSADLYGIATGVSNQAEAARETVITGPGRFLAGE